MKRVVSYLRAWKGKAMSDLEMEKDARELYDLILEFRVKSHNKPMKNAVIQLLAHTVVAMEIAEQVPEASSTGRMSESASKAYLLIREASVTMAGVCPAPFIEKFSELVKSEFGRKLREEALRC